MPEIAAIIADMRARAGRHGRTLRFGYRTHIVVRETEAEARAAATLLLSQLDAAEGETIRNRSLDTASAGVSRQAELRDSSDDDGFIASHLWTGIARAPSGCGAAIVGDPIRSSPNCVPTRPSASTRSSSLDTRTSPNATSFRARCCLRSDRIHFGFSSVSEQFRSLTSRSALAPPLCLVNGM